MLRKLLPASLICVFAINIALASPPAAPKPDEGMWLPLYLKKLNERAMKSDGMKFSADDIYDINHSSFKDAVVSLGGFCTAEIVSNEGLLLTNHHCGYERIAEHSTVDHDYLKDGFWAKSKSEEFPNAGLTASILVYMEDETDLINNAIKDIKSDEMKEAKIESMEDSITTIASKGDRYKAQVKEFFEGNEYYLVVYQVFQDVRLVGAPPSSIGKFGGDVDNWMWPRHTGDFSVFRIYADKNNNPAPYSKDNVPYKPKYFFPISLKGEKQNDFAMVMGYPGHTERYLTSYDLAYSRDYSNPAIIDAFETQLNVMKKDMDADEGVKIKLAAEYAQISNTYKYYLGQELLLKHGAGFDVKTKEENGIEQWINADQKRKEKYGNVINDIRAQNDNMKTIEPALSYFFYGLFSSNMLKHAFSYYAFNRFLKDKAPKPTREELDSISKTLKPQEEAYFKSTTLMTDKRVFEAILLDMYNKIPAASRPDALSKIVADNKKAASPEVAFSEFVDNLYNKSLILDSTKSMKFLENPKIKKLKKDPLYSFLGDLIKYYVVNLNMVYRNASAALDNDHKLYIQALREWEPNKTFYPDANSTLRVTYGQVLPYNPRDAVKYKYYTTYEGILEKYNPKDPEFMVPQRELDLFAKKDFGRYAQNDTLRINFLANTDITGGNSGSPVLDANGNLIGLAFDGDWESMIGDLVFNPATNRTICVDIRYVLWIMDKYANAQNLINEMKIVE